MSRSAAIEAVCFDLGNVLVELVEGWADACRCAAVPAPASRFADPLRDQLRELTHEFEIGRLSPEAFYEKAGACTGYQPEQVRAVIDAWLKEPFPGIEGVIRRLEERGLSIAVLSNTNAVHWEQVLAQVERFAPVHCCHHLFASHLIGVRKPDVGAYEHVRKALGVEADRILFFDDREDNIAGAIAAGWCARRVDPTADPVPQIEGHLREHGVL